MRCSKGLLQGSNPLEQKERDIVQLKILMFSTCEAGLNTIFYVLIAGLFSLGHFHKSTSISKYFTCGEVLQLLICDSGAKVVVIYSYLCRVNNILWLRTSNKKEKEKKKI